MKSLKCKKSSNMMQMDGDFVIMGSYPQTLVEDEAIIKNLGAFEKSTWISYGYYIMREKCDFMYYFDKVLNDVKYRGVYFEKYRPIIAAGESDNQCYQAENGYLTNKTYWFRYEPIKWQIVERNGDFATLVACSILDCGCYFHDNCMHAVERLDYKGKGGCVYPNNYQFSDLRGLLNTAFLNTAFDRKQQALICKVTVDNGVESTGENPNCCVCANTKDKIWLLSYQQANNFFTDAENKGKKGTDYAKCQGLKIDKKSQCDNSFWWLRSPSNFYTDMARVVNGEGDCGYVFEDVYTTFVGIVPAIKIKLKNF